MLLPPVQLSDLIRLRGSRAKLERPCRHRRYTAPAGSLVRPASVKTLFDQHIAASSAPGRVRDHGVGRLRTAEHSPTRLPGARLSERGGGVGTREDLKDPLLHIAVTS